MKKLSTEKVVATNRRAFRDYTILDRYECGIELKGAEVKSLREARVNMVDSFARVEDLEVFIYKLQIQIYEKANQFDLEPARKRKLLLHKREIAKIVADVTLKSRTLIPLKIYFKRQWAKIEIGVAVGKRKYDKRETIKKRSADREIHRALKKKSA